MTEAGGEVTQLLARLQSAEPRDVVDQLLPLVYDELHAMAAHRMRREARAITLSPTALVHEAFLRLVGQDVVWRSRAHFLGVAAMAMRRVLLNAAEARGAQKRGGRERPVHLEEDVLGAEFDLEQVVTIDGLMTELAALDERQSRVVELKVFGGMTADEIAEFLEVSRPTVQRDWRFARAWMAARLTEGGP